MAGKIRRRASDTGHDPDSRYSRGSKVEDTSTSKESPLASEEMTTLAKQCEEWFLEARDMHAESRCQRFTDHDYYDHQQISDADMAVYEARNQAPIVHNLIHGAIDWLSGTERRTRVDWHIDPRGPEDEAGAKAQTHLLKFVSDANRGPWERSRAFKDAVISGVGFMEEFKRQDASQSAVGYAYSDWRNLWWDPYSRDPDFGDARYFHRVKFCDLDRAAQMFPERAADLRALAISTYDNEYELLDEAAGLPGMLVLSNTNMLSSGSISNLRDRYARRRVRLFETWYPRASVSKKIMAKIADCCDLEGLTYDPTNGELKEKLEAEQISLIDSITTRMHLCIWTFGAGILAHRESPYSHNLVPFTANWCYRNHRDGMPYGFVRGMRDPQDEYNKRRAKALYAASVNQVYYENDAFDEDDEDDNLEQISMPNGEVRLAPGGLKKVEVKNNLEVSNAHVAFMAEAKQQVYEGNGVTRENLGQETNSISGRAILAKQQQGSVQSAEVFDMYRLAFEISGQKLLENIKKFMPEPRMVKVLGGNEGAQWVGINQPYYDHESGEVRFENDVLNTLSDFKVDAQDYRETVRMAMAESLLETIGKMPPELALQLLDLALELTDLPNKQEILSRIRKMNGAAPPAPLSPEQQAANDQQAAAAQAEANLSAEERAAKADRDRAQAEKLRADAKGSSLNAQRQAIDTAQLAHAAMPFVTAADALFAGAGQTPPQPVPPGVQTQ